MPAPKPVSTVKPFPISRRLIMDSGRVARRQNAVAALLEVDVTEPRRILREHKEATGEALSFTAFIIACLGAAIDANKYLHARRNFWNRLILFEDVDCTTLIEIEMEGQKFPLAHIIRSINHRSVRSIHDEIRQVQTDPQNSPSLSRPPVYFALFLNLPTFVRDLLYAILARSPELFKQSIGTVQISSVGMFGSGAGWGITAGSFYTTNVLLGSISEKPAIVNGGIVGREILHMTITFDHDIVDGAPAARFANRFKTLIETAHGLDDLRLPAE